MIQFRPYQQPLYDDIMFALKEHDKVLAQAETGWGKSILIGGLANTIPGRNLILTHRIELLEQNSEWIEDLGILTSKVKKVQSIKESRNVISMTQTMIARINKYGADYVGDFDTILVDEVHQDYFKKVYDHFPNAKVIGVTATPIVDKKIEKNVQGDTYVKKITMANEFGVLLQGVRTKELIDLGYLTKDFNIALTPPNLEALKNSSSNPDGYTSKSMSEVFGSSASLETVIKGYDTYCSAKANQGVGKKTIIFNPTTKVNKKMYEAFTEKGIDCKLYDSVNPSEQTRNEITEWFRNTPGAVLMNVGVFTTGFSVNDLEAIIYNKKTKSLSLWLQSIGRGSRILTSGQVAMGQYKPNFLVLDLGLNIAEHGRWSDDRDWSKYFIEHEWKLKKPSDLLQMWDCSECGAFNLQGELYSEELDCIICPECKAPRKQKQQKKKYIDGDFVVMEEPMTPQANKTIEYVKKVGGNTTMVLKIARMQILELFKYYTTKEDFEKRREAYNKRMGDLYRPFYFGCIYDKEIKEGANKTLAKEIERLRTSIENFYNHE